MPINEYNQAQVEQRQQVPEHVHTVTTITQDATIQVPAPAPVIVEKAATGNQANQRRVENGFGI